MKDEYSIELSYPGARTYRVMRSGQVFSGPYFSKAEAQAAIRRRKAAVQLADVKPKGPPAEEVAS